MNAAEHAHLDDSRLVAARTGRLRLRRDEREHLAGCPACATRDREWAEALAQSLAAAQAQADEAFPPSRLARQRDAILQRLQRLEPARVLAFPTAPGSAVVPPRRRSRVRWIAAAAAAGLVIAAFTGQYIGVTPRHGLAHRAAPAAAAAAPRPVVSARIVALSEDEFLLQVDDAIGAPRVAELQEIDDLTPRLRDAAIRIR